MGPQNNFLLLERFVREGMAQKSAEPAMISIVGCENAVHA